MSTRNDGDNVPIYSVSEVSGLVKSTVENAFGHVRVRGEISGFKRAASGHLYFGLKDENAVLDGVCWRTTAGRLGLRPEDGMEVVVTGRVTTYPGRSKYQIVVEAMELAGEGALLKLLEDRKRKLAAEGLFDAERKRGLPVLPTVIGVVTSPTGAVIRDILHRLGDRFPRRVLVWPVLVQGEGAATQIAAAIRGFDTVPDDGPVPRPDVLIVARGGGSLEDLWAFNEEDVVRAAADCRIPLISAVGHETDWTLIDLAADVRAPTPSAAAEMAVPVRIEVMARIGDAEGRLIRAMRRILDGAGREVVALSRGLPNLRRVLEGAAQRLDDWDERLSNALTAGVRGRRARLPARVPRPDRRIAEAGRRLAAGSEDLDRTWKRHLSDRLGRLGQLGQLLQSYSYERVLERGFALVTTPDGKAVTSVGQLTPGRDIRVRLKDGIGQARVVGAGGADVPRKRRAPKDDGDDPQGSLL